MRIVRFSQHANAFPPYLCTNELVVALDDGSEAKIETDEKTIGQLIELLARKTVAPIKQPEEPSFDEGEEYAQRVMQNLSEHLMEDPDALLDQMQSILTRKSNFGGSQAMLLHSEIVPPVPYFHRTIEEDDSGDGTQI